MSTTSKSKRNPYAPPSELHSRRGTLDYAARLSSPTLVEFLVIFLIIGILVALLLPAVDSRWRYLKNTETTVPAKVIQQPPESQSAGRNE